MNIFKESQNIKELLIKDRRYFHENPEVGFLLTKTTEYIKKELEEIGCHYSPCGKSGLKVVIGNVDTGKSILLRADMDALPIKEETDLPFRSKNGAMHACGHDFHAAILLGVARILKRHENEIQGSIILMFQPAEEILSGAKEMISAGILSDPKPDAAIMLHVITGHPVPAGTLILPPPGPGTATADYFEIEIKGIGCHGSTPHLGIDPLTASAHLLIALQEIQARELAPNQRISLTVCALNGGTVSNAIPDKAVLKGALRCSNDEIREQIKVRLIDITHSVSSAFRCSAKICFTAECPMLMNDQRLINDLKSILKSEQMFDTIFAEQTNDNSGSEDFAFVSQKIPSVMLVMGAGNPRDGYIYPPHHSKANFDENTLTNGVAVLSKIAFKWLEMN